MKRVCIGAVLCLLCGINVIAQVSINATLSGTVSDTTGALIAKVEVVATNKNTGVVITTSTNESGRYRFPSLQPGNYEVKASIVGFQTQTFGVTLGTAQQIVQNFVLQVGSIAEEIRVTAAADELLTASTAAVGTTLQSSQVTELPLVGRNVMDLVTATMPGVTGAGQADTTFAGITANGAANVTMSMDGVTMNTGRHTQGLKTSFFVNPDMIDEMRVVVAPVDVEGRGAAQIQMRARSGTNQLRGSATWNIRNSALNANTWSDNRQGLTPAWYNRHQTTVGVGGPIFKNKTFFYVLYDRNDQAQKQTSNTLVLTPLARQGIFRFFPGVNNGNADATPSGSGTTRIAPVVDKAGNPLDWTQIPGATGPMQSFSVFGDSLNPGDPNRRTMDPTGFIANLLTYMPPANAYDGTLGDGLNTATHRFVRRTVGGTAGFTGENMQAFNRWQINIKIDHNFNAKHRLSGTWVDERHYTDNNLTELAPWPTGFNGEVREEPKVRTLSFTSTLRPTLLNEFRFGYRQTSLHWTPAVATEGVKEQVLKFLPVTNGYPVYIHPALFANHVIGSGWDLGNTSPLTTYSDTVSWMHGSHAFKFGVEWRYASTKGYQPGFATSSFLIPTVTGGAGNVPVQGISTIAPLLANNRTLAENILLFMSGSVSSTAMRFETWQPTDTQFRDYKTTYLTPDNPPGTRGKIRQARQNEFNWFVKDDWKIRPNLTLNLGVRWDLFRVPDFRSGTGANWTRGPADGNAGYFGISGRNLGEAFHNGGLTKGGLTEIVLIGNGSKYPDMGIWPSDRNNFAPAVGFSWAPDFLGKDKTTIRGGYQIAYLLPGNGLSWIDADSGNLPGLLYVATDTGGSAYRNLTNLSFPLAAPTTIDERVVLPVTNRSLAQAFYSPDYRTPYIQTYTLGVTRALPANLILDVRYVGTRGTQLHSTFNYNQPDFRSNGLLQALTVTRAGGDDPMFDRMLKGLNFGTGIGVVGVNVTGSEALRRHASFRSNIANGDFMAVATTLNTANIGVSLPPGQTIAGATLRSSGLFPENFITANPQFAAMEMRNNSDTSIYHSMQTQITMRPFHRITFQGTWTWSRASGVAGSTPTGGGIVANYRDFLNRKADYTLSATSRTHDFRGYSIFELPFGPNRLLGKNAHGVLARLIEGWTLSTVFDAATGFPLNVVARNTIDTSGTPDIVGDFPRDGRITWGSLFGNYFTQRYTRVPDPACASVAANLKAFCTNTAIADASGKIILQNAAPGQLGTLGLRPFYGPGTWSVDANLQKSVRIDETRNVTIRLDVSNVFNHPTPASPNLDINSGTFGEINTKVGSRSIAGQVRFQF